MPHGASASRARPDVNGGSDRLEATGKERAEGLSVAWRYLRHDHLASSDNAERIVDETSAHARASLRGDNLDADFGDPTKAGADGDDATVVAVHDDGVAEGSCVSNARMGVEVAAFRQWRPAPASGDHHDVVASNAATVTGEPEEELGSDSPSKPIRTLRENRFPRKTCRDNGMPREAHDGFDGRVRRGNDGDSPICRWELIVRCRCDQFAEWMGHEGILPVREPAGGGRRHSVGGGDMIKIVLVVVVLLVGCGGGADAPSSGAPADPLTVSEALASDLDEPLLLRGLFIDSGEGQPRLCEVALESFPPQCGEPSLPVEGATPAEFDGAMSSGGVTWVDDAQLLGHVEDGVMTVSDTQL